MAKNQELLDKLNNGDFSGINPAVTKAALEALSKADPNNPTAFRQAFIDHKNVWKTVGITGLDGNLTNDESLLAKDGEGEEHQKNKFEALRQAAAERRVSLDISQLFNSWNYEQLAKQLASADKTKLRDAIGNQESLGLLKDASNWEDNKVGILSDKFLEKIQTDAKARLNNQLKGFIQNTIPSVNDALNLLANLYKEEDFTNFKALFPIEENKDWMEESVINVNDLKETIKTRIRDIYRQKITALRDQSQLTALLKAKDLNAFRQALDGIEHVDDYSWLDSETMKSLKDSARTSFIEALKVEIEVKTFPKEKLPILLRAVDVSNAQNLSRYLKDGLGIANGDQVKNTDLPALLPSLRTHAFALQVEKSSLFGADAHRKLIETFKILPLEKQAELMTDLPKKVAQLTRLENVEDVQAILGVDENTAGEIVEENKRLADFKKIHNAEIARILARHIPPIEIDDNKVIQINLRLEAALSPEDLARTIKDELGLVDGLTEFYKDLGLVYNSIDNTLSGGDAQDAEIRGNIAHQKNYNRALNDKYTVLGDNLEKAFYSQLLSIRKLENLENNDIDTLFNSFKESTSFADFQKKISSITEDKFDPSWTQQFTAADFDKLKLQQLKGLGTTKEVREYVNARLDGLSKVFALRSQKFWNETQLRRFQENFTDREHWFNPAFMGKSKADAEKMKPKFEELARNIDIIIQEREYQREAIQSLIDKLPDHTGDAGNFPKKEYDTIKEKLERKIKEIDAALENHKKSRNALQDVLDKMQKAIESKKVIQLFGSDPDVVSKVFKKGTPEYNSAKTNALDVDEEHPESSITVGVEKKEMKMHEMDSDQVRIWDVSTTKGGLTTRGRIIEEHGLNPSAKVYASDKQKITPTKLTIDMPKGGRTPQERELMEEARVKTAMVAVCQLFAKLDVPPDEKHPININCSDPEDAKYFWTAVKIVQKELKDTKLAFKDNAIQGDSIKYVSKTQKGKLGWKDDSVYKTVFEKESNKYIWKQKTDELKGHISEKFKHDKEKKESSAAATQLFRKEVKKQISESEKHLEEIHKGPQVH